MESYYKKLHKMSNTVKKICTVPMLSWMQIFLKNGRICGLGGVIAITRERGDML